MSGRVAGAPDVLKVRQFCFRIYVARKEIEPNLLNEQGVLGYDKDPYAARSIYFVVRPWGGGPIVAASRLIMPLPGKGADSLQIDINDLNPKAQLLLKSYGNAVAEPSSFAKRKSAPSVATTYLIREMLHYSHDHGIKQWLIALNPHIEGTYNRRFGPALYKLGDRVTSKVDLNGRRPVNVPYVMDVDNAIRNLEKGNVFHRLYAAPIIRRFMSTQPHARLVGLGRTPETEN